MPGGLLPFYAFVFILSLLCTALLERRLIPLFSKIARQPIYEEGPSWHMKKSGTPTMGGLAFIGAVLLIWPLSLLLLRGYIDREGAISLSLLLGYALLHALLGFMDDLTKLRHRENAGLSAREKLIFQFLFAALFLLGRAYLLGDTTSLSTAIGSIELGVLYYPLALLVLVGTVNFANLTDGIDGLASSVAFGAAAALFFLSASNAAEVALVAVLMMGVTLGFLLFNLHPARIFMGDTGSLFLGALTVGSCFSLRAPTAVLSVGAVYILEGVSVMLQVAVFKLTRRRLFRMAPLHHHFERCGWSENRICLVAILLTLLCSLPAVWLYVPHL